jgi:hypothetical protein
VVAAAFANPLRPQDDARMTNASGAGDATIPYARVDDSGEPKGWRLLLWGLAILLALRLLATAVSALAAIWNDRVSSILSNRISFRTFDLITYADFAVSISALVAVIVAITTRKTPKVLLWLLIGLVLSDVVRVAYVLLSVRSGSSPAPRVAWLASVTIYLYSLGHMLLIPLSLVSSWTARSDPNRSQAAVMKVIRLMLSLIAIDLLVSACLVAILWNAPPSNVSGVFLGCWIAVSAASGMVMLLCSSLRSQRLRVSVWAIIPAQLLLGIQLIGFIVTFPASMTSNLPFAVSYIVSQLSPVAQVLVVATVLDRFIARTRVMPAGE